MNMEDLPIELLSQILKYLNLADRREFALVSKQFYEATLDPALYTKSTYAFDAQALITTPGDNDDTKPGFYCKSPNIYIHGLEENLNVKSLLCPEDGSCSILGPHVLQLSLKGCSILQGSLVKILKKCETLEGLDLTGCNAIFMAGPIFSHADKYNEAEKVLRTTKHLTLGSLRYLTDASLSTLVKLCPELTSISLASCNMLYSEFGRVQRLALTFDNFCQLAILRSSTLTRIDLSRTGLTSEALRELSYVKGLKLEEIVFQNCRELSDYGMIALVKKQPGLRLIDVRGCYEVGDQTVSAICCCALDLRELYLAKCRAITDSSASKILMLTKLRILDVSECFNLTAASISGIANSLDALHTLRVDGCNLSKLECSIPPITSKPRGVKMGIPTYENMPVVLPWSPSYRNLTDLSISSGKYVTDRTIQSIFVHMTSLHRLSLSWCPHITDAGLLGIEMMLPQVDNAEAHILSSGRFSLAHGRTGFLLSPGSEFSTCVDWDGYDVNACMQARGIVRLRSLRRLFLSNCPNLTDESLVRMFCTKPYFPHMEHLDISMLKKAVTDDVLNGISLGCPLMRNLSLSCTLVTDNGVGYITSRLHRLEVLKLCNCDQITTRFFQNLTKHTRWLRELDISSCKQIPPASADKLAKALPLLTKIHTRFSGEI